MSAADKLFVRENGDRPRVCTFNTQRRLTPCWPMEDSLGSRFDRGTQMNGLKLSEMYRREPEYGFSRHAVTIKSGKLGKRGAEITFCPFCRTPMSQDAEELVLEIEAAEG